MLARCLLALFVVCAGSPGVRAADLPAPFQVRPPVAADNPCGDTRVLTGITKRFAWAEQTTWHRGFVMAALHNARPSDHRYYEPGLILRRYCQADSAMSNGLRRQVYYVIEVGQGFASVGNTVDFCVLGLDPWHIYDEACRTVR